MKGKLWILAFSALIGVASVVTFHAIFLGILLILWIIKYNRHLIIQTIVIFFIFFFYAFSVDSANKTVMDAGKIELEGVISAIPIVDGDHLSFDVKAGEEKLKVNYFITSEAEKQEVQQLQVGLTCRFAGSLESPSSRRVPSLFDYELYLYYNKIHWIYELSKKPDCKQTPISLSMKFQQFRQEILTKIIEDYPSDLQGIAASLLIGDRSLLPSELEQAYQDLGLSHVLAVSGLHVGVTGGLLFWVLIRCGVTRERSYLILIIFFPVYMMITGCAPSVVRASFMAILVALSLRMKWKINPIDGISITCLLILMLNPYYVFHIGFQLSFLIAFSLIVSSGLIVKQYQASLKQLLAVSTLAQVVSFSTVLYHFHQISFLSLPVNLIYVPIISVIVLPFLMFLTFIHAVHLTFLFEILAKTLSEFVGFFHEFFLYLADFNHILIFGKLQGALLLASFGLCLVVLLLWEEGSPVKAILIWLSFCSILYFLPYVNPYGEVTFIDVGQGDCILIRLPFHKKVILIDTGGRPVYGERKEWQERDSEFDVGEDIVVPYLKSQGIRSIDLLILTHGDYDHAGGAQEVLDEMNVKQLMVDRSLVQTELELRLIKLAHEKGTNVINAQSGQMWGEGHQYFAILQALEVEEENNGSIILYAKIGGYKWLFTGDLEEAGERELLANHVLPKIDILKAGHHGSASSSSEAFLEELDPSITIISAGVDNRYGHPDSEVVERFENLGINIIRTDLSGTITYRYLWHRTGKWKVMINGK